MVRSPITFDSEDVTSRKVRCHNCEIDPVTGTTNLCMHFVPVASEQLSDLFFKYGIKLVLAGGSDCRGQRPSSPFRVFQIGFKVLRSLRAGSG